MTNQGVHVDPRIDSLVSPHLESNISGPLAQGFTPKTTNADSLKITHLKPSGHHTGTTTVPCPKLECDLRYQRIPLLVPPRATSFETCRRKHSPTKRNPAACPRDGPGLPAHWTQSGGIPVRSGLSPGQGVPETWT
jgi:hypothetical protein